MPEVAGNDWPLVELDRFVLARLEEEGLAPVGAADRRALVRRLSFDLTGLPPTPQEARRFIDDDDPHAYSALVDRLLASPAYGEHWARWWLDVAPSHPELLEHLAFRFRESGRSLKSLQRMPVTSATYRLSREADAASLAVDPDNRLLWHASRRRLSAEQFRDAVLAVSGALDRSIGGPSKRLTAATTRRTLYAHVSRFALHEYLRLFDFPSPSVTSPGRFTTDVPAQRLFLSNSEFVARNAELLAARVLDARDEIARIERLYDLLYGRKPVAAEVQAALEYIAAEPLARFREQADVAAESDAAAEPDRTDGDAESEGDNSVIQRSTWGRFAAALLGSDEFLHID